MFPRRMNPPPTRRVHDLGFCLAASVRPRDIVFPIPNVHTVGPHDTIGPRSPAVVRRAFANVSSPIRATFPTLDFFRARPPDLLRQEHAYLRTVWVSADAEQHGKEDVMKFQSLKRVAALVL